MQADLSRLAFLVGSGGRCLAVGSDDEIRAMSKPGVRQVDVGGKTIVPGFVDPHSHPSCASIRHLRWVDCGLRSITAIQDATRAPAARTPPGDWVIGFKYDDVKTCKGRKSTRADFDAAALNHPVFIEHLGGHTAYVNSLAYRRAETTGHAVDPR
jgi:predicted amidohydrolase YtcJ